MGEVAMCGRRLKRALLYYFALLVIAAIAGPFGCDTDKTATTTKSAAKSPRATSVVSTPSQPATDLGRLALTSAVVKETRVAITGATDMPDGTKVGVTFDVWGRPGDTEYIGVDGDALVSSGTFSIVLDVPQRAEFKKGPYEISLLVTPKAQNQQVLLIIGEEGENLLGPQSKKSELGFRLLEVVTKSDLKPVITIPTYTFEQPSAFQAGSAERVLAEYMSAWRAQDWARMTKFTQLTWRRGESDPAQLLAAWHDFKALKGFRIEGLERTTAVANDITYVIWYEAQVNKIATKRVTARVIKETAAYEPSTTGEWGVNPTSTLGERDY